MKRARVFLVGMILAALGLYISRAQGAAQKPPLPFAAEPQLVLLDTDIGDDIDDAFALALLLQSPEVKLLGITTTYGDTALREKLVRRFLWDAHFASIPTVPGVPTQQSNSFTQAAYARRNIWVPFYLLPALSKEEEKEMASERSKNQERESAASFLLEQIRQHPAQITLLAIGPLFNIQAAIEKDPATFRQLKRVVLMGGSIDRGYDGHTGERRAPDPEWNISRNPAGLRALLASGVPVFLMPLDSTQIRLDATLRDRVLTYGSPLTDQLTLLYTQWQVANEFHATTATLYDPVAAAYVFRPDLCPTTALRVEVDAQGRTHRGTGTANAQVCLQADEAGFMTLLGDRLLAKPQSRAIFH